MGNSETYSTMHNRVTLRPTVGMCMPFMKAILGPNCKSYLCMIFNYKITKIVSVL